MSNQTTRLLPAFLLSVASMLPVFAEEVLLEDFQYGGTFDVADWANAFTDSDGNQNAAFDDGDFALVRWATKWSGIPSTGTAADFSKFKTFQVDVMVEKGQPVEDEANFYFQLLDETDQGYAYWETFVAQNKVPADGKWYRVQFPISTMVGSAGDGAEKPTDFKTIMGCCCGMTFDPEGENKFKFKRAFFDNVTLSTEAVDGPVVKPSPKSVNPPKKK